MVVQSVYNVKYIYYDLENKLINFEMFIMSVHVFNPYNRSTSNQIIAICFLIYLNNFSVFVLHVNSRKELLKTNYEFKRHYPTSVCKYIFIIKVDTC